MMKQVIKEIVRQANIGSLTTYEPLSSGFASQAYELSVSGNEFVLLNARQNAAHASAYKIHFAWLRALETSSYKHAPKAIYLSKDAQWLLITKAPGDIISHYDGSTYKTRQKIAINVTDALMELGDINVAVVNETFTSLGLGVPQPVSPAEDWKIHVVDRFYPHVDTAPADAESKWIEAHIESNTPHGDYYYDSLLTHGDTSTPNIIVSPQLEVTFIDWGDASFSKMPSEVKDFGLAYTFNHVAILQEFKEVVLDRICTIKQYDPVALRHYIDLKQRRIKLADIVWAFMMYCRSSAGEIDDSPDEMKRILQQRIQEYKDKYGL